MIFPAKNLFCVGNIETQQLFACFVKDVNICFLPAVVPGELPLSSMLLLGMIVAVCIFMAFGMYCERRKR